MIDFRNTDKPLDIGSNLKNPKRSPSLSLLSPSKGPADVAPNEEENLQTLAKTSVSAPREPQAPVETSVESSEAVPVLPVGEPQITTEVPAREGSALQESTIMTPRDLTPDQDDVNPFLMDMDKVKGNFSEDIPPDWAIDIDDLKGNEYGWDKVKLDAFQELSVMDMSNNIAYGIVKGAAATSDILSVPVWALTSTTGLTGNSPFVSTLEHYYPEKNYEFQEVPGYLDDALRMTQTSAEFASGGGLLNVAAKGLTKGAYKVSMADDLAFSLLGGLGYQGALEAGASDTTALLTAFLAPTGPALLESATKATWTVAKITTVAPSMVFFSKLSRYTPFGMVTKYTKHKAEDTIYNLQSRLTDNPKMWDGHYLSKKARELVLSVPEKPLDLGEQKRQYKAISKWMHEVIPDSPEIRAHVDKMRTLENKINSELPEGAEKLQFTLEQVYGPVLTKQNQRDGLNQIMHYVKLSNGEQYDSMIRQNRRVMFDYLEKNRGKLGEEETEAFTSIFKQQLDEINNAREAIYAASNMGRLIDDSMGTGYTVADDVVSKELRPLMDDMDEFLGQTYKTMLDQMPQDIPLDTTPLKESVRQLYSDMGAFADPSNVPAYLKSIIRSLSSAVDDRTTSVNDARAAVHNLAVKRTEVNQQLRDLRASQADEITRMGDAPDPKELKTIKARHTVEKKKLEDIRAALKIEAEKMEATRPTSATQATDVSETIDALPEPNLFSSGEIVEGLKEVNKLMREAYSSGNFEQYKNLERIKQGLSKSFDNLAEVDEKAHQLYRSVNDGYSQVYARDFNESFAGRLTDKGDHLHKLTSGRAVNQLWENADVETIDRFVRNFDGSRDYLDNFFANLDVPESTINPAKEQLEEMSQKALGFLKDTIYTSLGTQFRQLDMDTGIDPANRLARLQEIVLTFQKKHGEKLKRIPGMESLTDDMPATIAQISKYKEALKVLDEQAQSSILTRILGPGHTGLDVLKNRPVAEAMRDFLTEKLPALDIEGIDNPGLLEAQASEIRRYLRQGLVNEFTKEGNINFQQMDELLAMGSETRNNLSMVLGESEVIKLDMIRYAGRALNEGETTFTALITDDPWLRKLEQLGLPLGRIGSLLQRRAIFTPSGGYIAGAVSAKLINSIGAQMTSKALKIMVDRPLDLLHIDQILLNEMKQMTTKEQSQIKRVLEDPKAHLRELASWFPARVSEMTSANLAYLGIEMSRTQVETLITEALMEDPRHPTVEQILEEYRKIPDYVPEPTIVELEVPEEETP